MWIKFERGAASIEMVVMAAALVMLMYVVSQITSLFLASSNTMIKAQADVWDQLNGISTPCLENAVDDKFAGGRYTLTSDPVTVGIGSVRKEYRVSKTVTFLVGEICN